MKELWGLDSYPTACATEKAPRPSVAAAAPLLLRGGGQRLLNPRPHPQARLFFLCSKTTAFPWAGQDLGTENSGGV